MTETETPPVTETAVTIEQVDIAQASDSDYRLFNTYSNLIRAEVMPDDPPTPLEETIAEAKNIPEFVRVFVWVAWNPDKSAIIGSATVSFLNTEENKHLAGFEIDVLPEHRRRGLGRRLLAEAAAVPKREGRRLMMTGTNARVPAGEAFLARIGGDQVMEAHTNQLTLAGLDRDLLAVWDTPDPAGRFALESWDGPYPDTEMEEVAAVMESAMNTMPRDKMDMEDMHFTAEQIRQMERQTLAGGNIRWTLAARETASGRLAGFTEALWNPSRPHVVRQAGTGVLPEFQGHGLGKRLKAAMLNRVLEERPDARFVRTGNADSNGPMLRINHALGFRPYLSRTEWQVETDKALAYAGKSFLP